MSFNIIMYVNNIYSLLIFGGNLTNKVKTNNLIISCNLDYLINKHNGSHGLSRLISGYINEFQIELDFIIPNVICSLIEKFYGFTCIKKEMTNICARADHNGTILYIKNIPYLFIFGGYNGIKHLNDIHFIDLNCLKLKI